MISRRREREIQGLAREKLVEYGVMNWPVDPIQFARSKLSILVEPFAPPEPDISGFLMRLDDDFGIGYSEAISSKGFQNFTVAHELGHYFIDDHPMAVLVEGTHMSKSGFISKDRFEREADVFATEFLMPWKLIQPIANGQLKGLAAIQKLSDQCESSLVASSIRYASVTRESAAVVVSHQGKVEFMTASESFRQIPGIDWLKRDDMLPKNVPSARLSDDEEWIARSTVVEEGSRLSDWFSGSQSVQVEEDVIGLGSYGRLLTVLFTELQPEDEEEDEPEDDYIDRWNEGRFREKKS